MKRIENKSISNTHNLPSRDSVIDGEYKEKWVDPNISIKKPLKRNRNVERRFSNIGFGLAGTFGALAGMFGAMYLYVLLSRAYNHLPFIGIYDALSLLSNGNLNPFADFVSQIWSYLDAGLGTIKLSFQTLLPDSWKGIATVLDYTVNFNYIVVSVLQMVLALIRFIIQIISCVYAFGNFVTTMATSGNGIWKGVSDGIQAERDALWLTLIS